MRWIFFLLLLVNALYLGWQIRQPVVNDAVVIPENVTRLRLLKEEDLSLLLPRESVRQQTIQQQPSVQNTFEAAKPEAQWCQVVSGIAQESVAVELQQRLELQGFSATLKVVDTERVLAYELTLERPSQPVHQRALVDNLEALGLSAEEAWVNQKPVYIIGRYDSRAELNRTQNLLIGLFQPDERLVVGQVRLFEVWVAADDSVRTANEIKGVDQFFNSAIKIEKKSCKGVASTGVRD